MVFLKWLFGDPEGHFMLLFLMLCAACVGMAFGIPHSYNAVEALSLAVFVKVKS